jgi:hypothetical protein
VIKAMLWLTLVRTFVTLLGLSTAAVPGSQGAEPKTLQNPPPRSNAEPMSSDMVVIDGRVEPERIPEYALWRGAFYVVAHLKRERASKGTPRTFPMIGAPDGTNTPMELSERDADLLEAEAARQRERDVACDAGLQRIIRQLTDEGKNPDQIADALVDPIIECRWKDLEARDRVLSQMSEEGAALVRAWVNGQRYTSSLSVTKRELPYVMLPQ